MKNPFEYGGVVGANSFCNRKQEIAEIQRVFENGGRLFLYSERRIGKTSLVKLALNSLSKNDYIAAYVDLWPTTDGNDFALRLAKSVAEATASTTSKMLDLGKSFFSNFKPAVTVDESGNPQLVFGVNKDNVTAPALEDVLNSLPKIAKQSGKRLVVVLDEFQQITEYGDDSVEKTLRSAIQHHDQIAYVFLGSKKHVLEKMFVDKQRPLYRSASHYPLRMIATNEWLEFIAVKFETSGKTISETNIRKLCGFTQGHPFYTQNLSHALWELTEANRAVEDGALELALNLLLRRETFAFTTLWDSLSANQKTLMTAISIASQSFKPFGSNFVSKSGMRSASNVQRATESLLNKDLIDRDENGQFFIPDQFLRLWIKRRLSGGEQFFDSPFSFYQ